MEELIGIYLPSLAEAAPSNSMEGRNKKSKVSIFED